MKKSILSASIAAMIGGLGLVGAANAVVLVPAAGATVATELTQDSTGIGHILLVPYFTTQGSNATLLNITNTDATNGKLVKVRFRGASNSDDIFDFQLLLSPSDVWAGKISKGADGRSQLETSDKSCALPLEVMTQAMGFPTGRLKSSLTAEQKANETREGYIEILAMADIPKTASADEALAAGTGVVAGVTTSALYATHKHDKGIAPCSSSVLTAKLGSDIVGYDAAADAAAAAKTATGRGLAYPSGKLMANWTIIDTQKTATFSGEAVAIRATNNAAGTAADKNGLANLVFFPQLNTAYTGVEAVDTLTADPLLRVADTLRWNPTATPPAFATPAAPASGLITAAWSDFPDLSTPYVGTVTAQRPIDQAVSLTGQLATKSVVNEFLTTTSIAATTDWVFSMPTRRYNVAMNYAATGEGRVFTNFPIGTAGAGATLVETNRNYFTSVNTSVVGDKICVSTSSLAQFDREETPKTTGFAVSPGTVETLSFCGETSVLAINNGSNTASGSMSSTLAIQNLNLIHNEGWLTIGTLGLFNSTVAGTAAGTVAWPALAGTATSSKGLPVIGAAFAKSTSFGASWSHRYSR